MRMRFKTNDNVLHILRGREYGFKSNYRKNLLCLKHIICGTTLSWSVSIKRRHQGTLHTECDLLLEYKRENYLKYYVMKRMKTDGSYITLWKYHQEKPIKDLVIHKMVPTEYDPTIAQKEYRPVIYFLDNSNTLSRVDLLTGTVYDLIKLNGNTKINKLYSCPFSNLLVAGSGNTKCADTRGINLLFYLFKLHPFHMYHKLLLKGANVLSAEDKQVYGSLKSAEITDDMVLINTSKSYTLFYSLNELINLEISETSSPASLLYAIKSHEGMINIGGNPWMCTRGVSDSITEVMFIDDKKMIKDNIVKWTEPCGVQITQDNLQLHPDDTNRLIHTRPSDFRILSVIENKGKYQVLESFRYPREVAGTDTYTSRAGRRLVRTFVYDYNIDRCLVHNYEDELDILIIMECFREVCDSTKLNQLTFYDSVTMKILKVIPLHILVGGDIATNKFHLCLDRDTLNITISESGYITLIHLRLKNIDSLIKSNKKRNSKLIKSDIRFSEDLIQNGRKAWRDTEWLPP